jgi:molybdate transport system substrate-binding protein
MIILRRLIPALFLLLFGTAAGPAAAADPHPPLLVFAAASLTDVLQELGLAYEKESGQTLKHSFAASSALARQIESGARADVFVAADTDWMDYLQSRKLIDTASRVNLLSTRLVLIAPVDSTLQLKIAPGFALAAALGKGGRLSTGDPDAVPVGKYAKSALISLGVWPQVADRLARADNVRTALTFVERGETPLGIVYAADAKMDSKVRVIDTFPASSHPPIIYPIAAMTGADTDAARYIAFLRSLAARTVFERYGFTTLQP